MEEQAEIQAKKMKSVVAEVRSEIKQEIKNDIKNQRLATANDLKDLELRLIKWVIGTGFVMVGTTFGTLLTLVKLFVH